MTRVNLPDGSVINFPDDMPPEQMQAEIERYLSDVNGPRIAQPPPTAEAQVPYDRIMTDVTGGPDAPINSDRIAQPPATAEAQVPYDRIMSDVTGENIPPEVQSQSGASQRFYNTMDRTMRDPDALPRTEPGPGRDARRVPMSPAQAQQNAEMERAQLAMRDEGPMTAGGGARQNPPTPDMPYDRRVPAGPEAGMPERNVRRGLRDADAGAQARGQAAGAMPAEPDAGAMQQARFEPQAPTGEAARDAQTRTAGEPGQVLPDPGLRDDEKARRGFGRSSYLSGLADAGGGGAPSPADTSGQEFRRGISVRDVDPNATALQQDVQRFMRRNDIENVVQRVRTGLMQGEYGYSARPATQFFSRWWDYGSKTPEQGAEAERQRELISATHEWFGSDDARAIMSDMSDEQRMAAVSDPVGFFEARASVLDTEEGAPVLTPEEAAEAGKDVSPNEQPVPARQPLSFDLRSVQAGQAGQAGQGQSARQGRTGSAAQTSP
ncbi:hypothetical protein RAZWK3B_16645 [Roseobacter sp. AzwK-3b]|uniref:hypothetical protein n=1 Tax=Roseobacter sp. AzwK-3b TaxID=351016 RepID=UPI0001569881|nr:hypothetical protein [Roseobacter sp. AzwK-3b]EDM71044.1 hypothetical protein RAZWK3B_16645 [Roseobacter sp. AzwK-3b]